MSHSTRQPFAFREAGDGARRRRPEASPQAILAEPSVASARVSFAGLSGSLWPSRQVFPLSHLSRAFYVPSLQPPCSSTPTFHLFLPPSPPLHPGSWKRGSSSHMGTRTQADTSLRRRQCGSEQRPGQEEFRSIWKEMQESQFPAGTGRGFSWISIAGPALREHTPSAGGFEGEGTS